jgi:stage 0 sporulation regulatory protein
MSEVQQVALIVEDLRKQMNYLLTTKSNLLDPNIIAVSQLLDIILIEYYRILNLTEE